MNQWIDLAGAGGFALPAWQAAPDGAPRAALVVLPEIFGVNGHIRAVADRLAARGYLALAPDMFARLRPGVDLGYAPDDVQQGIGLKAAAMALPAPGVLADVQAAIDHAGSGGLPVGVVGFCWGGLLAWQAACTLGGLRAAVCYYGGGMTGAQEAARQPRVPVLAHFGRSDTSIPLADAQAFARTQPGVEVCLYDAGHGFNCDLRASYDESAAMAARDRTLAFFDRYLEKE